MEYLRKVVRTNKEPDEKEVLWVDTAHPDYPVMKYYENGNWKLIRQREDGVAYIMPYGGIPYSDLSQEVKMAIASGGAQANWNQTNSASPDFIWNKPYIPTALADLTEDSSHKFVSATEKTSWNAKYERPSTGIPSTDLASAVQTTLGKVDGIEAGAQVNTVERLVIDGNVLTPDSDKSIVILLKTLASQRLDGSGDVVQGPFTIVPTSLLCAAKSLNFTAIIFNSPREIVGLWVCRAGNDNSDKFYRVLSTSNAKCYKSSNYHVFDAENPGNYYALVISASESVTFTTANISSSDRTEQTAITIADRGCVDTAVAAKYTKPASGIPASDLADGVIPDISGKADAATTLAGYGITDAYTKTEVDSKVASTYKPAGSVANVGSLGSLTAANLGKVYNFTASFTTTSDFVEGSGKTYPVGTNVVIVDVGTAENPSYKYDVLAGFVDLSSLQNYSTGTSFPENPKEGDVFVLTQNITENINSSWETIETNEHYRHSVPAWAQIFETRVADYSGSPETYELGTWIVRFSNNNTFVTDEIEITEKLEDGTTQDFIIPSEANYVHIFGDEETSIYNVVGAFSYNLKAFAGTYQYTNSSWVKCITEAERTAWNANLGKADTAYQKPSGGIPKADLVQAVQDSLGKADGALQGVINDEYDFDADTGKSLARYVATKYTSEGVYYCWFYGHKISDDDEPSEEEFDTAVYTFVFGNGISVSGLQRPLVLVQDIESPFAFRAYYLQKTGSGNNTKYSLIRYADEDWVNTQGFLKSFTETDPTVPSWAKASSKPSYDYSEINNTPTIPDVTGKADKVSGATNGHLAGLDSNGNLTDSGKSASDFQPTIDSSHKLSYTLLSDTPTIPAAQVQTDWNATSGMGVLLNKPTLATVATSGSYNDLSNKPSIPSAPGTLNTNNITAQSVDSSEALSGTINLHKVAKTGTYSDLIGTPTIPTVEALTTSEIDTIWSNAS